MIELSDMAGKKFILNSDLIFRIDKQYDTIITLTDSKKLMVRESPSEIVEKVKKYQQQIHTNGRFD